MSLQTNSWIVELKKNEYKENLELSPPVAVQGKHVSFVDSFVYLGSAIDSGRRPFPKINRPQGIASCAMISLNRSVFGSVDTFAEE